MEPKFEIIPDHDFKEGEKIFVIDANRYDIWAAVIKGKKDDKYTIHYDDYPEDDEEITGKDRLLVETEKNKKIFEDQEKIRLDKEKKFAK